VALRDTMRDSAAQYLRPGEPVQAVVGAQTASQWLAALTGFFVFLGLNRYRILAVMELPRSTRLGPGTGMWHQIPAGTETLRVHRRFFKDMETADTAVAPA
jgi:hypothetical protein